MFLTHRKPHMKMRWVSVSESLCSSFYNVAGKVRTEVHCARVERPTILRLAVKYQLHPLPVSRQKLLGDGQQNKKKRVTKHVIQIGRITVDDPQPRWKTPFSWSSSLFPLQLDSCQLGPSWPSFKVGSSKPTSKDWYCIFWIPDHWILGLSYLLQEYAYQSLHSHDWRFDTALT